MAENQTPKGPEEEEEEERDGKETEQQRRKVVEVEAEENPLSNLQNSLSSTPPLDFSSVFNDQNSQSETLVDTSLILSAENDQDSDCPSFSQLLNSVMICPSVDSTEVFSVGGLDVMPTISTLPESLDKGGFGMSHEEVLETITAQDHNQSRDGCPISSMDLVPVSVTQSTSSISSIVPPQQTLPPVPQDNNVCKLEIDEQKSFDQKVKPAQVVAKTPTPDGYNWRKYGQKPVKSTESNRSYYRCTYVNCHAKKKVERCDHSGRVVEIIYKGRHNHDPPRKTRSTKARRYISSAGPGGGSATIDRPLQKHKNSDPSKSRKENRIVTPKPQQHSSMKYDENARIKAEEEQVDEPIPKRSKQLKRIKQRNLAYSAPLFKTVKEPKIVVQTAGDVGISGDGFRWRKYGQKMVKGNPNPRSYYKCTSAGCLVRKHVERATDDTTAIIITYEGKHDHDMPVPKKRHGPPSTALLIAAAAAAMSSSSSSSSSSSIGSGSGSGSGSRTQLNKSDASANQEPSTHWSMDMEGGKGKLTGEKAVELGGERVLESARTLLSIGIELKPY